MGIDFHARENQHAYTGRAVNASWFQEIQSLVNPSGKRIVDIGCGGGIYSQAWSAMGASSVIGVDFSQVMLEAAKEQCKGDPVISFVQGDALATGLEEGKADIVFARALIHHLQDLEAFFAEVSRLLTPGGICLIQDRTVEDVLMPASPAHLRGYIFEKFPRLIQSEQGRRPADHQVKAAMQQSGLEGKETIKLWEVRREYQDWSELEADLLARKGRSILHELQDSQLQELTMYMKEKLQGHEPIREKDCWSIWRGEKVGTNK
ncbi:methyltransferase [Brevibacillus reuszeri]|uniref:Methyltransferase n=1 Tax=Brevibacillus reuszeri TaxID=54915 RepID=A0A0K9YR78_9BACL|nr:class I SAM-dependent methyltransferase [Brevibacillus reuszeri]KNB71176.1 methyltransferase type 11 [Brevibacillus reuszeri]MED1857610.1 class I SAM-dependent methyltransferase [Brevibacillus reuszeri]GED66557.1 methyltransferase [Brevibacillus reuszeri]